jgi:hypothetical protein
VTTKRRHIGARNLQVLSVAKESYLRSGAYLLPPLDAYDRFEDEDEARASWAYHRERLLADWNTAGRRPWALWAYDLGLAQVGSYDFEWPEPYTTEGELVHAMLKAGELEPCRLDGINRLEHGEVAEIEREWLHACRCAIAQTFKPEHDPFDLTGWRGVPRWFYDQNAPALRVEIAAERSAWRRSMVSHIRTSALADEAASRS